MEIQENRKLILPYRQKAELLKSAGIFVQQIGEEEKSQELAKKAQAYIMLSRNPKVKNMDLNRSSGRIRVGKDA